MTVFISRDLSEAAGFQRLLVAEGHSVRGFSLLQLLPIAFKMPDEPLHWVFFASGFAVKCFFEASPSPGVNPSPSPSPGVNPSPSPSPEGEGSVAGGEGNGDRKKGSVYSTDAERWKFLKDFARQMRHEPTEAERVMWEMLRGRRFEGLKFRRQHPIGDFIVDFLNLDLNLVIEIDGGIHAGQAEYDRQRTEWLESFGYSVLRFANDDVLKNLPKVKKRLQVITAALSSYPTPPPTDYTPLPFRGGAGGGVDFRAEPATKRPAATRFAALGPATAAVLRQYVDTVHFTGTGEPVSTAAAFRPLAAGTTVLFPAARHSRRSVPDLLGAGIRAIHLPLYDNAPLPDPPRLDDDVLVFTSPLNAQAYFSVHSARYHQKIVAIGPTTAAALQELGLEGVVESPAPSAEALAKTVLRLGN